MELADLRFLYDLSTYNCQHYGTYTSLFYEDTQQDLVREYTNVEIARESAQLAAGLRSLGIEKGDRVIVMMLNCPELLISYQAIARAGAVIIPVLPLLKAPEIHFIAQNSAAKAIITGQVLLPLLQAALAGVSTVQYVISVGDGEGQEAQAGRDSMHSYTVLPLTPAETQSSRDSDVTGVDIKVVPYADVVAKGAAHADEYMRDLVEDLSPDDTAVILYTSGTTGNPKGVVLTHRNVVSNAVAARGSESDEELRQEEINVPPIAAAETQSRRASVVAAADFNIQLAILPLAHAYGLVASNAGYLNGVTFVMHPRFDTTAVLSAIERYRVNAFAGVPAMFVALLYTPDAEKYDTGSLRYCVSGSAPLPLAILEGFESKFNCQILEGYGLSEASAVLTGHRLDMARKPGSVGKPIDGVELLIVDENDRPVAAGEVGEVIARGPNIMQGYYNMPDATNDALRNGWLHTGDMGRLDEDGYLYIVERKKDLIIRGGLNIYPRDVEEVLNSHPNVIESAVVGIPSERMGEEVKAFVVASGTVDTEALKAYCRERLANYKTPSEIEFVNYLPRNLIGKIDKKELRKHHVN